jgi:hypothetical protein
MNIKDAIVGAILMLSLVARAEIPFAPPSDIDLKAAYCIGEEEQTTVWENTATAAKNLPSDFRRKLVAARQSRLQRLHSYLDRRLTFIERTEIDGASKRGWIDPHDRATALRRRDRHGPVELVET